MERKIVKTADGSSTIFLPEWNEHYHSIHGAVQEAKHVFIKMGLEYLVLGKDFKEIFILEIGFGTGLNAFITLLEAKKRFLQIEYTGIEAYPISSEELQQLNYSNIFSEEDSANYFHLLHQDIWENWEEITSFFRLLKKQLFFKQIDAVDAYNLIYFDAFGPQVQPALWTEEIFKKMFNALKKDGVLVTYSAKGSVRRAMEKVGFQMERLPGPPGKREMLRAIKK